MNVKILLFGMLEDIAGKNSLEIKNASDTGILRKKVEELYPAFCEANYVIAVNRKIINSDQPISEEDEIALLPPFAGG